METGDIIASNLARIIEDSGTNNRAVAEAAGLGHTAVRDIITRKVKSPTYSTIEKLAQVLGVDVLEIIGPTRKRLPVAVAGRVGAGSLVPLVDGFEKGDGLFHVTRPDLLPAHGVVAVEVDGDSMAPMYQPGHVLFFSRKADTGVMDEDIGKPCVIEDQDRNAWVKLLKRGSQPGLWNLVSLNPGAESMWDVKINWAARVLLALPSDLAERS